MNRLNGILFLLALLFVSAMGCSSKRILPDHLGPFQRYTQEIVMHSDILGTDVKFGVLLPESYRDDTKSLSHITLPNSANDYAEVLMAN